MHEPRFAAGLDRDSRRRLLRSEQRSQRLDLADGRAMNDLSLG